MWNIHKMEYWAVMRLNDLVTCTWVCSFYKMPSAHLDYVPFFNMYALTPILFQKNVIKEAAAETAALEMCCDIRLRLCLTPTPRYTQGGWGHRSGSLCSSFGGLPLAVYLSSPREEACSLGGQGTEAVTEKRCGGMHVQDTKAPAANK